MSKITLIFATDFHFGTQTRIRSDNVHASLIEKLKYVLTFKRADDVLLLGGDLIDRPDGIPARILTDVMDVFDGFGLNGDNTFSVFGQHEIFGHNPSTISWSQLDFFCRSNYMTLLKGDTHKVSLGNIDVVGFSWNEQHTLDFLRGKYNFERPSIAVIHASISPHFEHRRFTINPNNIPVPDKCLLVLCGDIHEGFDMTGKFINPGAMVRKKRSEEKRNVSFLRITVSGTSVESIEKIPVPVKTGVFIEAKLPHQTVEDIQEILDNIGELEFGDILLPLRDPREEILRISRERGYSEKTILTIQELFDTVKT